MSSQITKLLNAPGIASNVLLKAVQKIAPGIGPFVAGAQAAGYVSDQVVDFLRNKYMSPQERTKRAELEDRSSQGVARPDERAELARFQQRGAPVDAFANAAKLGSRLIGGLGSAAQAEQLDQQSNQSQQTSQPETQAQAKGPDMSSSFLSQYPELGKFIQGQISIGSSPQEAAMNARKKRLLSPIISKIEGQVGEKFEDVVSRLFPSQNAKGADQIEQSLMALLQSIKGS